MNGNGKNQLNDTGELLSSPKSAKVAAHACRIYPFFFASRHQKDPGDCIWFLTSHHPTCTTCTPVHNFYIAAEPALEVREWSTLGSCSEPAKDASEIFIHTVDGRNPAPVEVGSFSRYLQGFLHLRCRISEPSTVFHWARHDQSHVPLDPLFPMPPPPWYLEWLHPSNKGPAATDGQALSYIQKLQLYETTIVRYPYLRLYLYFSLISKYGGINSPESANVSLW